MKRLLHILLSLQSITLSWSSIVSCKQNVRKPNVIPTTPEPSSSDKIKLTAAANKLKNINLEISVSELGKLDVLINAIKSDFSYKNIITEQGIELSKDLQLQQKDTNVLITVQNQNLIKLDSSFTVNAYLKLNKESMNTSFTVELTWEAKLLGISKKQIENLENSEIGLLVLQNKSELIKELKTIIEYNKINHNINIQSNSLKIYDKNNNLEITNANQDLIKTGFEVKVTLVLEYKNKILPVEFNCKIVNKNILDLEAVKTVKDKLENLSQPFEIKIGKTFDTDLLLNVILNHFKNNNYITNSNVILSNKLEIFELNSQKPIVINNIEFDTPYTVKTNIILNATILPITFEIKLIHSTDLDILATSIKKMQSYNGFKVYTKKYETGLFFWINVFRTNEFQENINKTNFINVLGFENSHFLEKSKIINKTSGEELEEVIWGEKVTLKGTMKIRDGELPFEFDVIVADPNENFEIQSISYSISSDIKNNASNYIKNKNYPSLSKLFIIQIFQDILVSKHGEYISKYGELEFFNLEFYKYDRVAGNCVIITNDNDIKYNEYIFIEGRVRIKNNHSIYGFLMVGINISSPNK